MGGGGGVASAGLPDEAPPVPPFPNMRGKAAGAAAAAGGGGAASGTAAAAAAAASAAPTKKTVTFAPMENEFPPVGAANKKFMAPNSSVVGDGAKFLPTNIPFTQQQQQQQHQPMSVTNIPVTDPASSTTSSKSNSLFYSGVGVETSSSSLSDGSAVFGRRKGAAGGSTSSVSLPITNYNEICS